MAGNSALCRWKAILMFYASATGFVFTNSVVEAAYSDTATYDPTTGNSGDDELL